MPEIHGCPQGWRVPFLRGEQKRFQKSPHDLASRASLGFSLVLSDSLPPKFHVPTLDEAGTETWGDGVGGQGTSS